jgi:hypothetical protein
LLIILNFKSLNNIFESNIPTLNNIKSITSPKELNNLQTGNASFHNHPFMLLPPFLWDSIPLIENYSPKNILTKFLEEIKSYQEEINSNNQTKNVLEACKPLLCFLWCTSKKAVPVSLYSTDNDDKHLQLWHSTRRSNCFQAPSPILPATENNHNDYAKDFNILSQSINNLPENLESALSSHSVKPDKDKKGFTHLHPSVQCLILNASSPTREMSPKAPSSFCTQFFKSRTSSDAKLCFMNSMCKDFNCHVDTDNGVITNIYNDQFLCKYVDIPSNF